MTDKNAREPTGWIYFDGDCRFRTAPRQRWGKVLERGGFVWIPLPTPGTAKWLGIAETRLHAEMWLGRIERSQPVSAIASRSVIANRLKLLKRLRRIGREQL